MKIVSLPILLFHLMVSIGVNEYFSYCLCHLNLHIILIICTNHLGRDRFIDNLSNLGSFIKNYDAKMISYDVNADGSEVNTKVRNLIRRYIVYCYFILSKYITIGIITGYGEAGVEPTLEASTSMALGREI